MFHIRKFPVILLCLIWITSFLYAQTEDMKEPKTAKDFDALARDHAAKGENEKAIEVYHKIIHDFPKDAIYSIEALQGLGRCYSSLGDQAKAIESYRQLINNYSASAIVLSHRQNMPANVYINWNIPLRIGEIYQEMGKYEEAQKELDKARGYADALLSDKTLPESGKALYMHNYRVFFEASINLYLKQGKLMETAKEYDQMIQFTSDFLNSGLVDKSPSFVNKEKIKCILTSLIEIQDPMKGAALYEKLGDREKAGKIYQNIDLKIASALENKKYEKNLPVFHQELPGLQKTVREKLKIFKSKM